MISRESVELSIFVLARWLAWHGKVWAHMAFFHAEIFEPRAHAMFGRVVKMKWRFVERLQESCVDHQ